MVRVGKYKKIGVSRFPIALHDCATSTRGVPLIQSILYRLHGEVDMSEGLRMGGTRRWRSSAYGVRVMSGRVAE